jgi:hypothetical protein
MHEHWHISPTLQTMPATLPPEQVTWQAAPAADASTRLFAKLARFGVNSNSSPTLTPACLAFKTSTSVSIAGDAGDGATVLACAVTAPIAFDGSLETATKVTVTNPTTMSMRIKRLIEISPVG